MELLPVQLESKSYFLAQDVCLPTSYLLQLPINRMWQCILIAQGAPLLSLEMWESSQPTNHTDEGLNLFKLKLMAKFSLCSIRVG